MEAELELSQRLKNAVRLVVSDHPLAAIPTEMKDSVFDDNNGVLVAADPPLTSGQLRREIDSVALDWRSLRNIRECVCSTPFDHFSKKVKQRSSPQMTLRRISLHFFFKCNTGGRVLHKGTRYWFQTSIFSVQFALKSGQAFEVSWNINLL